MVDETLTSHAAAERLGDREAPRPARAGAPRRRGRPDHPPAGTRRWHRRQPETPARRSCCCSRVVCPARREPSGSGANARASTEPFAAYPGESLVILIEEGRSAQQILHGISRRRESSKNAFWTRLYLSRVLEDPSLKAGEYAFDEPMAATQVLDKLIRGVVLTYPVTVIEGLDLFETARSSGPGRFRRRGRVPSSDGVARAGA